MHNIDPTPQGVENRNILLWFNERMSRYFLNDVETSHHLILIRLYFILTILITEDDHNHIVFDWIKITAV
jgi:hypothetical protein